MKHDDGHLKSDVDRLAEVFQSIAEDQRQSSHAQATAQTRISVAAVVVAVIAALVTIWQGCVNREYQRETLRLATEESVENRRAQRLSVRPHMTFGGFITEEGVKITISNRGLGPGVMKWFDVSVDGVSQSHWEAMCESLGADCRSEPYRYSVIYRDSVEPVREAFTIFSVPLGPVARRIWANIDRVRLSACFCSLYDDCWLNEHEAFKEVESCDPAPKVVFAGPPQKAVRKVIKLG